MGMVALPKCMFVYHMHAWWPKRVSEPLDLELQTVMNHVGAGN